jgi:predicted DNA-binding transcriptional regulator AlpA
MADKLPPWMDTDTLAWALCTCPTSIENYVTQGKLPPPRKLGGKRLWRWKEVEGYLLKDKPQITTIADAVKRERAADEASRY